MSAVDPVHENFPQRGNKKVKVETIGSNLPHLATVAELRGRFRACLETASISCNPVILPRYGMPNPTAHKHLILGSAI